MRMLITLPLYVFRELCKALGLAFMIFTFILLAFFAGQVIRDGASIFTVLVIMPQMFPFISPMVLPLTIITGILICYGKLASANEFIATQAGGVNPLWIAAPALVISFFASIITVYLNDDVLGSAVKNIDAAIVADTTNILKRRLSKPGSFRFQNICISRLPKHWNKDGKSGIDITMFKKPAKNASGEVDPNAKWDPNFPHQSKRYLAKHHEIDLYKKEDNSIFVEANFDDFIQMNLQSKEVQIPRARTGKVNWQIKQKNKKGRISKNRLSFMPIHKLIKMRKESRDWINKLNTDLEVAKVDAPNTIERIHNEIKDETKSFNKRTAELHFKLALSFACIGFAAIGIPLGVMSKKNSATSGFAYGTVIAVVYFVLVKAMQGWVSDGFFDWWSLWIPNALLVAIGVALWIRSQRVH